MNMNEQQIEQLDYQPNSLKLKLDPYKVFTVGLQCEPQGNR